MIYPIVSIIGAIFMGYIILPYIPTIGYGSFNAKYIIPIMISCGVIMLLLSISKYYDLFLLTFIAYITDAQLIKGNYKYNSYGFIYLLILSYIGYLITKTITNKQRNSLPY